MIDLHAHVLPGIDDGSSDIEETRRMLENYSAQGIKNVVASSHSVCDRAAYNAAFAEASAAAEEFGITLYPALEYTIPVADEDVDCLQTVAGGEYMLIDLENMFVNGSLVNQLDKYKRRILLVHPERLWTNDCLDNVKKLSSDTHAKFVVNAGSFLGKYGHTAKKNAWQILNEGYCSAIASDAHNEQGVMVLQKCRTLLSMFYSERMLTVLFDTNPSCVLKNQKLERVVPRLSFWKKLRISLKTR